MPRACLPRLDCALPCDLSHLLTHHIRDAHASVCAITSPWGHVQERPDGTNVNNWHWTERDVMGWSRGRLEELLVGAQLADTPQAGAKLTGVQELEGAAVLPWATL